MHESNRLLQYGLVNKNDYFKNKYIFETDNVAQ
jgi:hypothetical protein